MSNSLEVKARYEVNANPPVLSASRKQDVGDRILSDQTESISLARGTE